MSGGKCWNSLFIPLGEVTVLGGCQRQSQPPGFTDMCHLWWRQLKSIWGILLSGSQAGGERSAGVGRALVQRARAQRPGQRGTGGSVRGERRLPPALLLFLPRCAHLKHRLPLGELEVVPASCFSSSRIGLGYFFFFSLLFYKRGQEVRRWSSPVGSMSSSSMRRR